MTETISLEDALTMCVERNDIEQFGAIIQQLPLDRVSPEEASQAINEISHRFPDQMEALGLAPSKKEEEQQEPSSFFFEWIPQAIFYLIFLAIAIQLGLLFVAAFGGFVVVFLAPVIIVGLGTYNAIHFLTAWEKYAIPAFALVVFYVLQASSYVLSLFGGGIKEVPMSKREAKRVASGEKGAGSPGPNSKRSNSKRKSD